MNHNDYSSSIRRTWALRYGLASGRGGRIRVACGGDGVDRAGAAHLYYVLPGGDGWRRCWPAWPGLMASGIDRFFGGILDSAAGRAVRHRLACGPRRTGVVRRHGRVHEHGRRFYRRDRRKAAAYDREMALRETRREKEFLADILEHASQPFAVGYRMGGWACATALTKNSPATVRKNCARLTGPRC